MIFKPVKNYEWQKSFALFPKRFYDPNLGFYTIWLESYEWRNVEGQEFGRVRMSDGTWLDCFV